VLVSRFGRDQQADNQGDRLIINGVKIQWLMQFHGGSDRFLNAIQSAMGQCDAMADSGTAEALAFVHSRKYGVLVHPGQLAGKQFRQFFQHSFLARDFDVGRDPFPAQQALQWSCAFDFI